ncbi:BNR-4 repeat-containing protein [Kordia sp.]|uniref:BNR-4 repeat-containing protein n=1 Tax=Kordia sp. TaxID=1965332 RepID=UPI003B5C2F70
MKHFSYLLFFLCLLGTNSFAQQKAEHTFVTSEAVSSEKYQSMTFNGVWSWFSDPRAVYYEGKYKRTYAGWIDNYGDVHIGYYDHDTQQIASKVIYDNLEIDDHDNPSILFDEEGKLLVFFNTHLQDERPLLMRRSTNPEDISNWSPLKELYLNDTEKYSDFKINRNTYTNPVRLSKEDGKLYIFWRGIDLKPSFSVSNDNGETWSKGEILFSPTEEEELKTPYTKVYSDGISKIHFTFTDGHPTKEKKNGLYYMYYENGAFYKANGKKIKDISESPVFHSEMDVIYEADDIKSWNWDIAQDAKGNPIVTYVRFPEKNKHIYTYATFTGKKWKSYDVIENIGWFPETRKGMEEPEPHYAGGIIIDHETPNTVYMSVKRNGIFEIEQWTTNNNGKFWKAKKITENSTKNNVRPFAVRGAKEGNPLQVLWLQNTKYIYYAHDTRGKTEALNFRDRYRTAVKMNLRKPKLEAELTKENLINFLRQVAEHQLENPNRKLTYTYWRYGLGFAGTEAFFDITKEARYKNELLNIKQYEREEDEFGGEKKVPNLIWYYSVENNREYLQELEEVKMDDFMNHEIGLAFASMMRAIEKFDQTIVSINEIKAKIRENTDFFIKNLQSKEDDYHEVLLSKALVIYSVTKGIQLGLFDEKYEKAIIIAWKDLQLKLLEKDVISSLDNWTSGAILLAGKEVLGILNAE